MRILNPILTLTLCLLLCVPIMAATKAKPKTVAKPKVAPRIVKGTTQLAGENDARYGQAFTLGKDNPINITIKSVEYTCDPIYVDDYTFVPNKNEKAMLIKFNLHNPNKTNRYINWSTIKFTAIDSKDANYEYSQYLGNTKDSLGVGQDLKPAQKVDVYTFIKVPADAVIPKLMVVSDDDSSAKVIRYFFGKDKNQIAGLKPPYVDTSDPTGSKALDTIPAVLGTYYNNSQLAIKIDSISDSDKTTIADYEVGEGNKFVLVKGSLKNILKTSYYFRWDSLKVALLDADGIAMDNVKELLAASSEKEIAMDFKPGQEMNVRYLIEIPTDSTISAVQFEDPEEGRVYIIPIK